MKKKVMIFFVLMMHGLLLCMEKENSSIERIRYHCSPFSTSNRDDFLENVKIERSLFMQLYVQAAVTQSGINELRKINSFDRWKGITIKPDMEYPGYMVMTEKDLFYRLLTGIEKNDTYSFINGKKVGLSLKYYRIDAETRGMVVISDYCFEQDKRHHQAIINKFNALRPLIK